MKRPTPTTIANRFGRIALTTILAALALVVVSVPFQVINGTLPSLSSPIGLFFDVMFQFGVFAVAAAITVPLVLLSLWVLTKQITETRFWQGVGVLTVAVLSAVSAAQHWGEPVAFLSDVVPVLVYAATVFGTVAAADRLFRSQTSLRTDAGTIATASGVTVGFVIVAIFGLAIATTGVVTVADVAGVSIGDSGETTGMTQDDLESEYGHILAVDDTEQITCEAAVDVDRDRIATPAETHAGDLSDFDVETRMVGSGTSNEIVLEFSHTEGYDIIHFDDWGVTDGEATIQNNSHNRFEGGSVTMVAVDGSATEWNHREPLRLDDQYVEFHVATDDGEVIRYGAVLCTDGLDG